MGSVVMENCTVLTLNGATQTAQAQLFWTPYSYRYDIPYHVRLCSILYTAGHFCAGFT